MSILRWEFTGIIVNKLRAEFMQPTFMLYRLAVLQILLCCHIIM